MGRKLDLSGLTDDEAEHVLQVVQRDMQLRKTEEARLSEMKQTLVEEGSRCDLLSRQHRFNERCCIRCCSPFTFLLNPKRFCLDCCYNVCKHCSTYSKKDKGWLCSACQKSRLLKTQSLEWFYNNVRRRFKRFGSAKVLKNLYRRHASERGVLAELTEGSTYEESICNEGSVCESDSTFYRQSEEHSMAETISVALRVAEEAIDEAIAKAESQADSQERQNEAHYLRENRGELIEELATTIVQKIVRRRKDLSEMQSGCNLDLSPGQNTEMTSAVQTQSTFNASLWRSQSAFCLDERVDQHASIGSRPSASIGHSLEMKKGGEVPVQALPSWRSVDQLDNSMLQSPDGNWIAYQNTLQPRPSLQTKRKSLGYSILEKESGVVSAYDEMGSETEADGDGVWGAALLELRRKMSANKQSIFPESYSRQSTLPLDGQTQQLIADIFNTDTDNSPVQSGQDGPLPKSHKALLPFLKRKVAPEHRRPSYIRRPSIMDINFNPGTESSEDGLVDSRVKRSRRRRKNKREEAEWKGQSVLSTSLPDCSSQLSNSLVKRRYVKQDSALREKSLSDHALEVDTSDTATPDILSSGAVTPDPFGADLKAPSNANHGALGVVGSLDQELTYKLRELTSQVRETQFSSTEDELDRLEYPEDSTKAEEVDKVMGHALFCIEVDAKERSDEIEATNQQRRTESLKENELAYKLRELTSQVCETQLSSTEDELDRLEYETEAANQPLKTDIMEVNEGWTDRDKIIQVEEKIKYHVEMMVENAEEERSEKRQKGSVSEQENSEQNYTNGKTQMSEEMSTGSQTQRLAETDPQNERVIERVEKRKREVQTEEEKAKMKDFGFSVEAEQSRADNIETVNLSSEFRFISEDEKVEFDRITDTVVKALDNMEEKIEAFTIEGVFLTREENEGEKLERLEAEEERVIKKDGVKQEMEDSIELELTFVGGGLNQVKEKEINEGKINKAVALERHKEDTEGREDKECKTIFKVSEERVLEKDVNSQCDLAKKREEQRDKDPTTLNSLQHSTPSGQEEYLSPEEIYKDAHKLDLSENLHLISNILQQRYSAASLRSITTEVLKVLNATEDLIHGSMGDGRSEPNHSDLSTIPPVEARRLDEQLSRLEENVYVAAGTVYGLEAELGDLEECARSISGSTSERELAHLEDQVASAAAQVQQSELQVSDIASRIAALKNAGLNVAPQTQFTKTQTIGSSRKLRRRLPAPPTQDKEA
ncbi:rab effector MyRIP isoform X2 [Myxocyprinus asiaticus]|uniref:rab effector MyRIP isoform X2 n=1 Tax=Myxocyprinus asiaticus TaxID=70543 RepID=UPI0022220E66|nr:rab effector MyRIP isoform X2 [Myxocyprinus asiaticus]